MTSISPNLSVALGESTRAGSSIRAWAGVVRRILGDAPLVTALGMFWLLDGALQFQPFMFSPVFVNGIMAPTAVGNPGLVARPITAVSAFLLHDIRFWNIGFATIQVAIGFGLFWKRTRVPALGVSVAWALGVWWFGEGLGGVLSGGSPLMGTPGAVVIYALLAVLLWPATSRADDAGDLAPARRGPLGATTPLILWSTLWVSLAWYSLLRANRAADAWHDMIVGMTSGQPGWVLGLDRSLGGLVQHHGLEASVIMAVVCVLIGMGIHIPAADRPVVLLACLVGGFVWMTENFGGIFTGQGTDPNSGPLLVLLALAFLTPARARRPVQVL